MIYLLSSYKKKIKILTISYCLTIFFAQRCFRCERHIYVTTMSTVYQKWLKKGRERFANEIFSTFLKYSTEISKYSVHIVGKCRWISDIRNGKKLVRYTRKLRFLF